MTQTPPLVLAALVSSGGTVTYTVVGLLTSDLDFTFETSGWVPVIGVALFSSVMASGASLLGVARIGPTKASILTMMELPLTVLLAVLWLGERLLPVQVVGGACVLSAVVLLQMFRETNATTE